MENGDGMKVNSVDWTWYMWASTQRPSLKHLPAPIKKIENRRVEESLETYDREGQQHKRQRNTFVIKA